MRYPSDKLDQELSRLMTMNNLYRERLKESIYLSGDPQQPLDRMEHTLQLILKTEGLFQKITDLKHYKFSALELKLKEKVEKKDLSQQEMDQILAVEEARWDAVLVDEFSFDSMKKKNFNSIISEYKSSYF